MLLLSDLADDGRPFFNDDLDTLQTQLLAAATATLPALGSVVLSGCDVTPGVAPGTYNVAPGAVWIDTVRQFPGAEGVALPGFIAVGAAVPSGPRQFETGVQKNGYVEYQAAWATVAGPGGIAVTADNPGLTYWQAAAAQGRSLGEVQWLATPPAAEYDAAGLGRGAARGWGLCNGQGGRADLRGQFVAGLDPTRADYNAVGHTGGEERHQLTNGEMPRHNHTGGDGTARFAKVDGQFTQNTDLDNSPNELNLNSSVGIQYEGNDEAHENRPPYYVLAARQWVGF